MAGFVDFASIIGKTWWNVAKKGIGMDEIARAGGAEAVKKFAAPLNPEEEARWRRSRKPDEAWQRRRARRERLKNIYGDGAAS